MKLHFSYEKIALLPISQYYPSHLMKISIKVLRRSIFPALAITDKSHHLGRGKKKFWSAAKTEHTKGSVFPW